MFSIDFERRPGVTWSTLDTSTLEMHLVGLGEGTARRAGRALGDSEAGIERSVSFVSPCRRDHQRTRRQPRPARPSLHMVCRSSRHTICSGQALALHTFSQKITKIKGQRSPMVGSRFVECAKWHTVKPRGFTPRGCTQGLEASITSNTPLVCAHVSPDGCAVSTFPTL